MPSISPMFYPPTAGRPTHWRHPLMCAPSPPAPPDYQGAAQAQGEANAEAARIQGKINNPNVVSPYGTQQTTWSQALDTEGYNNALKQAQQGLIPYPKRSDFIRD